MSKQVSTLIENEVAAWLREFAKAYSRKDLAAVMAMIDPEPPLLVLGSGPDEQSFSREQFEAHLRRDFFQVDQVAMNFNWIKTDAEAHVAWFASESTFAITSNQQTLAYLYRFTGVLVKRDDQWRLRMGHLGQVVSSQSAGQSWPAT